MKNVKRQIIIVTMFLSLFALVSAAPLRAQGPEGRRFGFGITLGDPLGGTIKYWTASNEAFVASLGADYFGSPRLNADYHWHFNPFNSNVVKLYAGPGLAVGFGEGRGYLWYNRGHDYYFLQNGQETRFGIRALLGLNIIPRNSPVEIYTELGPLIGVSPAFGSSFDFALGIRFYL